MNTSPKSDMKSFLDPTIKAISKALELPASIWLFCKEKREFRIVCAFGLSDEFVQDAVVSEERAVSVIKEKFENRKSLIVSDIQTSSFWKRKAAAEKMNLKSAVASTLRIKTRTYPNIIWKRIYEDERILSTQSIQRPRHKKPGQYLSLRSRRTVSLRNFI